MCRVLSLSLGAVALAFLGSQHHNLMMLLFAFGLGNAGMSVMTEMPLLSVVMLAVSLVMAEAIGYQISRPGRPFAMRLSGAFSLLLTLGIVGWSILRFGV